MINVLLKVDHDTIDNIAETTKGLAKKGM